MKKNEIIYLCVGYQDNIGLQIANSGENGGFDYDIDSSDLAIYLNRPIDLNFELSINLIQYINRHHSNGGGEIWRACGDKSPIFNYNEKMTRDICAIFNFYYSAHNKFHFEPANLHVSGYKIELYENHNYQRIYNVSSLYSVNNGVRQFLWNCMMRSLTYARNLQWRFKNRVLEKSTDATYTSPQYIPIATNNSFVKIICGFVYPFDEFIPVSDNAYKCICHRPIFTIFLSNNILLSLKNAEIINNIIDKLSPTALYSERQNIGENIYRFSFDRELTHFMITYLNLLFNDQYKFSSWDFSPKDNIEYVDSMYIIRRYKNCINLNARIYEEFEKILSITDKAPYFYKIYPVDCLHKYDCTYDNFDSPF